jgi:hypothetical protein
VLEQSTSALSGCSFGLGTASKPARNRRIDVRKDTKIARLARELTEAWEQQAATSEILRVISSSHSDLQPVFDTIARSAVDLCGATYVMVFRYDRELLSVVAHYNLDQTALDAYQMTRNMASQLAACRSEEKNW